MIPFNKPYISPSTLVNIEKCLKNSHQSGDGPFSYLATSEMTKLFKHENILLTPSGTHALELALFALDLEVGDEVIVPSYTFSSVANAVILAGGKPVFADISEKDLNLQVNQIESKVSKNTRALIIVHYAGVACDLDDIINLSKKYDFEVIEDNAHGIGARYKNQNLGNFGSFSTYSFHETKNIQTGEGGALIINNKKFLDKVHILREKGTNRKNFHLGLVDKYTWIDRGSSWLMPEITASILYSQLLDFEKIKEKRNYLWHLYSTQLKDWGELKGFKLPSIPEFAQHNSHIFHIRVKNEIERNMILKYLNDNKIMGVFHYQALHKSSVAKKYGFVKGFFDNSEFAQNTLIRLPLYFDLSNKEMDFIIDTLKKF